MWVGLINHVTLCNVWYIVVQIQQILVSAWAGSVCGWGFGCGQDRPVVYEGVDWLAYVVFQQMKLQNEILMIKSLISYLMI